MKTIRQYNRRTFLKAAGMAGIGRALGQVTATGPAKSIDTPVLTLSTPVVTIGDATADVQFSGLAPGLAGTYKVVAVVPDSAPSGDAVTLVVTMNGVPSNPVTIAIQ